MTLSWKDIAAADDPSLRCPGADLVEKAAADLARHLAKKKDDLLTECVTERLGHSSWQLFAIAHRLGRYRINDSPSEIWTLDGVPMIEFWPPRSSTVDENRKTMMKWTIQHRKYPKDTPPIFP